MMAACADRCVAGTISTQASAAAAANCHALSRNMLCFSFTKAITYLHFRRCTLMVVKCRQIFAIYFAANCRG
jgi:hypothetical protein